MRLWIGGPTRDTVPARFALDLAQLYAKTRAYPTPADAVVLGFFESTYVHVGRERVLESAIQYGATHVLWLDSDMTFPPETALRLALHDQPFVACNCRMRDPRPLWTAMRHGMRVPTSIQSTGLEDVDSVGLAVALMRTDIVADLPKPWFRHEWNVQKLLDIGEDLMFCRALSAAGCRIVIDHDLSKEIGHIGQFTYRSPVGDAALAV